MFSQSSETRWLIDALEQVEPGKLVTYASLNAACGRDVQADGRGALLSARRWMLANRFKVFGVKTNEGLVLLRDEDIPGLGEAARVRIYRMARRKRKELDCVQEFANLSLDGQRRYLVGRSFLGFVEHSSSLKTSRKIENVVKGAEKALDLAKMLKALEG